MYKIHSAENLQTAYLIQSLLAKEGIKTQILNEYAQGGIGDISFIQAYPEIWLINEADKNSAQSIIDQFEQTDNSVESVICPNCNEENPDTFEVCWHCLSPLVKTKI